MKGQTFLIHFLAWFIAVLIALIWITQSMPEVFYWMGTVGLFVILWVYYMAFRSKGCLRYFPFAILGFALGFAISVFMR